MLSGCPKCTKVIAALFLLVGILHLGQDYGWWDFWILSWYTTVFLVLGIIKLGHSKCNDCQAVVSGKKK
jgi:fatty acid desaturase